MKDKIEGQFFKSNVRKYWEQGVCGTENMITGNAPKYSRLYFNRIEENRYKSEPEIFSFAQFTRFHGKKVLEVGVGAGTDFVQWARAGACAYGIDATQAAIEHTRRHLERYGLFAKELKVADCEDIPYQDNTFDCVYSWGVIHHSHDVQKAIAEIVRVCQPGGVCKIMVYHRNSLLAYFLWIRYALLRGKPWKSLAWCIWNYMESAGTKAFIHQDILKMIRYLPVKDIIMTPVLTVYDRLTKYSFFYRLAAKIAIIVLGGNRAGWFLTIEFRKSNP